MVCSIFHNMTIIGMKTLGTMRSLYDVTHIQYMIGISSKQAYHMLKRRKQTATLTAVASTANEMEPFNSKHHYMYEWQTRSNEEESHSAAKN